MIDLFELATLSPVMTLASPTAFLLLTCKDSVLTKPHSLNSPQCRRAESRKVCTYSWISVTILCSFQTDTELALPWLTQLAFKI